MCGITGYIGNEAAAPVLLRSLKKLEYRGYDSAGIAILRNDGITLRKMKGRITALENSLAGEIIHGTAGIGHSRWATHGEPSDINAHPHTDEAGRIAIVHNGIIENYIKLKQWLQAQGVVFRSDTDTEVVVHLINFYYKKEKEDSSSKKDDLLFKAVNKTLKRLEGSYALGVICADYPDRIIAVRKDVPLIIGFGKNENLIASDVPALLAHTRDVYFLNDNEITVLYRDHVDLFNDNNEKIICSCTHIDWDVESAEKGGYPHFMLKEIFEQPKALADTLNPRIALNSGRPEIIFDDIHFDPSWAGVSRIVITACGTAYHAGIVGKYAFEHFARIPVEVDIASEYRYRNPVFNKDDLFIVISQSGETADTLAAMRLARSRGARVLAITNAVGSTLSREADSVLYTRAGPEIAVASTKAFTTQMLCIYLLALKFGRLRSYLDDERYAQYIGGLKRISENVQTILSKKDLIQRFASLQFNKTKVFFIGRQFDYAACLESALKLKEISYTHSEAFAAGELKHGAIALVDNETLVVTLATQHELFDKIISNVREVTSRGCSSLVVTYEGEDSFDTLGGDVFFIPKTEDCFSPLLSIIPMQLFAYYCAVQRGNDPDKPRNLAKSVTVE